MRVLLVRHATAVDRATPGLADDARSLTPRGRRRFARAAAGLARLLPKPGRVLTSPLLRAAQTAEVLARAFGGPKPQPLEALARGERRGIEAALRVAPPGFLIVLVGHEPHLSGLLADALGGGGESVPFKKGGAALLELPDGRFEGGRLLAFLPPRVARAIV
ncbi:MAG: histidine phosphatase family protein [Vicinamibacteria bacterium]|jgi:phosphohistidine phosphatase|nr:histidine phosphatase family protein [Vicinamibacteria bacterium]